MKKRINKILWYGSELENGKAKVPSVSVEENGLDGLNEGELYISNNEIDPALFIRTSNSKVVRLGEANYKPFKFEYDESIDALVLSRTDGKPAHFLATGALSTRGLGEIEEGGGGTGTGVDLLNIPSDVIPIVGGTYNLGSSAKAWKMIYANGGLIGNTYIDSARVIFGTYIQGQSWVINPDGSATLSSLTINGANAATQNWVNSQSFAKISDLLSIPSDIIPNVGGSYSLGTSGKPWKELFVGDIRSENIMPSSHYTYSLGADENRWSKIYGVDIYATRFTMNGEPVATRNWVNSQGFAKISDLSAYVNAEGGTINNAILTGDVTGNGWSIEGGIANFGEVNTDSLYVNGEGVLTSSSLANYVTLNSAQTISGRKTFTGGITASHLYSVEYLDSSELIINAEKVNFTYNGDDADVQIGLLNGYKPLTLGNTSFSPALTSGTVIGTITIGGESKTIFAPNGGSADLSNYVTLDSEQNITGSKYFSDLNANSIYLQGFELKPHSLDGSTPDRLMYDGYVLLDEYNYSEYLDSAYIKKSGDTVTGQITSSVADGTAPFVVDSKTEVANLHSATATKLHTARTLWGHPFDGSSNISGSLGGVTTITGVSSSSLLIHSSGSQSIGLAYNGDGTKAVVLDNSSFRPYSTANGLLNLGASNARWKGIYVQSLDLSDSATIGGSLTTGGNILPSTHNSYSLGATDNRWSTGYFATSVNVGEANAFPQSGGGCTLISHGYIELRKSGSAHIDFHYDNSNDDYTSRIREVGRGILWINDAKIEKGSISPVTNNGGSLGTSYFRWLNGYIDNLYSDVIYADTLTSRTSPYLNVTAASLDLISCELYGYDSDGNANWNIASNGIASFNSVVISSNDHIHTINGNADGELVIWPSEYLVIENDTITDYAITCSKLVQTSDIRYKNILSNVHLKLSDIAAAPTFKFSWANDIGSTHIGTSAQYWQEIAGELVVENKKTGKLGLDYSTAALVSAVSIAREVNTMKMWQTSTTDRIEELEDKVKKLEEENKALRELLNNK